MNFQETKSKALSVIHQLREIANASVRNVLKDADGKFQKDLIVLEEQINTARFTVGVVGTIKTGKSTFLNALLHKELLNTDVVPETAVITTLKYNEEYKATAYYWTIEEWAQIEIQTQVADENGKPSKVAKMVKNVRGAFGNQFNQLITQSGEKTENISLTELAKYTSANAEKDYALLVREVEIGIPLEFCKENIQIVDTPGLNDPIVLREYITVERFLPYCDMLVLLLRVDEGITDYGKKFLEEQIKKGQLHNLMIVMSKIDGVSGREVVKAVEFLYKTLKEILEECDATHLLDKLQVFPVSALQSLLNRDQSVENKWIEIQREDGKSTQKWTDEKSGMPAFETGLRQFLFEGERAEAQQRTFQQRLKNIVAPQSEQIDVFLSNSSMPLEELEKKVCRVKQEHEIIISKLSRVESDIVTRLSKFKDEYDRDCVKRMRELLKVARKEAEEEIGEIIVDFFKTRSIVTAALSQKKWVNETLKPSVEKVIKGKINSVVSTIKEQVDRLCKEFLKDTTTLWGEFYADNRDITITQIAPVLVRSKFGGILLDTTVGYGAGVAGGIGAVFLSDYLAGTALVATIGVPILVLAAIPASFYLWKSSGEKYEKMERELTGSVMGELKKFFGEAIENMPDILGNQRDELVKRIHEIANEPANEIRKELQRAENELDQVLAERNLTEEKLHRRHQSLIEENAAFKRILMEIDAMLV